MKQPERIKEWGQAQGAFSIDNKTPKSIKLKDLRAAVINVIQDVASLRYLFYGKHPILNAEEFFNGYGGINILKRDTSEQLLNIAYNDALTQILTDDFANLVCDNVIEHFASNEDVSQALKVLLSFGDPRLLAKVFTNPVVVQAYYYGINTEIIKETPYTSLPLPIQALILSSLSAESQTLSSQDEVVINAIQKLNVTVNGFNLRDYAYGAQPTKQHLPNPLGDGNNI